MSLKPHYAEAILAGEKRCEFRRSPFAQDVGYVVIYATKPVGKVVGYARVTSVTLAPATELWDTFSAVGGVTRDEFFAYFKGKDDGVAICLDSVVGLGQIELTSLEDGLKAPQSFRYLDRTTFCSLMNMSLATSEA